MIETTQNVVIERPLGEVWSFARDIERWASLMPGLQDCEIIDEDHSRWVLKVGAGGMVRTVAVLVQVDEWDGPGRAAFSYRLEKDPVEGGGTYTARSMDPDKTEVELHVSVIGSGPMAPMWEAMGKPLLPKLASGFADSFKKRVEQEGTDTVEQSLSVPERVFARLLGWLNSLFGRSGA